MLPVEIKVAVIPASTLIAPAVWAVKMVSIFGVFAVNRSIGMPPVP